MKTSLYIKSPCASPCVPQHTRESAQLSLQMFITVNHWSGWRPLMHYQYWPFPGTPLR